MATLAERFIEHMQGVTPGYRLVKKEDSKFMKFLAIILFFNRGFMTRYTTTIGKTVYMPGNRVTVGGTAIIPILAHEAHHIWDSTRPWVSLFYAIGYLMPQILTVFSLLALLAIWYSNWWLISLACLLFILPIPAPIRMWVERRGYLMTLACRLWMWNNADKSLSNVLSQFTGWGYYKMWPFRRSLENWFKYQMECIKQNKFPTPVYSTVLEFLKKEKLAPNS